jgi:hypothetical protein
MVRSSTAATASASPRSPPSAPRDQAGALPFRRRQRARERKTSERAASRTSTRRAWRSRLRPSPGTGVSRQSALRTLLHDVDTAAVPDRISPWWAAAAGRSDRLTRRTLRRASACCARRRRQRAGRDRGRAERASTAPASRPARGRRHRPEPDRGLRSGACEALADARRERVAHALRALAGVCSLPEWWRRVRPPRP